MDIRTLMATALAATLLPAFSSLAVKPGASHEAGKLSQLAEDHLEGRLALFPLAATEDVGDTRFEGALEIEIAPANREREAAHYRKTLQRLVSIRRERLDAVDRLTFDLLHYDAARRLEALRYPRHLLPIEHMDSVPLRLAQWAGGQSVQPFKTVKNYENFLKRLERLAAWNDQAIANMREGMRVGITRPRAIVERVLPQFEALAPASPEESAFYSPIKRLPESFSAEDKNRLTAAYRAALAERVLPAQRRLYAFLKDEYLPRTNGAAGLGALPGGADWYRFEVRNNTTTSLTPDAIHAIGLKEVARIRAEMEKVKAQVGFQGTLTDFLNGLEARRELAPFATEADVLARFAALNARVKPQLPKLFGRLPKAPLEIRGVDPLVKDTASSHYILPSEDGSRPGVFYAVVQDPAKYTTPSMTALLLHEGQPGHHFHMALQQELDLPRFRRFDFHVAYGEGWALYAEGLGHELGVYGDPYAYLGRLKAELHRAARLVTDTGLHAQGWSRERSIRYMMETESLSEADARRATERYMAMPGQALAYKLGELKFLELRGRAQRELGARFDIRAFHDQVLGGGALPLNLLEAQLNAWIARQLEVGKVTNNKL